MTIYTDAEYYKTEYCGAMTVAEITPYLGPASRDIDILTYSRIESIGFDNLTDRQKRLVQQAVCQQAEFRRQNEDLFESIYQSYSINGVSASLAPGGTYTIMCGIPVQKRTMYLLTMSGLGARCFYPGEVY